MLNNETVRKLDEMHRGVMIVLHLKILYSVYHGR